MATHRPPRAFGALVTTAVLDDLLIGVEGDTAVLLRFIDDFVSLWGRRVSRLRAAVSTDDADEAVAALESIRCSSTMLGAVGLAARAEAARRDVVRSAPLADIPVDAIATLGQRSGDALLEWSWQLKRRASTPTR